MENNLENKAKFFAQYWGQKVYKIQSENCPANQEVSPHFIGKLLDEKSVLELKPLSSITDEDAVNVWDLLHPNGGNRKDLSKNDLIIQGRNIAICMNYTNGGWMVGLGNVIFCFQYLQSKGYALPWMGLSVEKQIEYGWVKLEDK